MAVAKRNLEEIGESLENMGMNDRPSLLNTEMAKSSQLSPRTALLREKDRDTNSSSSQCFAYHTD